MPGRGFSGKCPERPRSEEGALPSQRRRRPACGLTPWVRHTYTRTEQQGRCHDRSAQYLKTPDSHYRAPHQTSVHPFCRPYGYGYAGAACRMYSVERMRGTGRGRLLSPLLSPYLTGLTTDRSASGNGPAGAVNATTWLAAVEDEIKLQLFVDATILEVLVRGGSTGQPSACPRRWPGHQRQRGGLR